MTGAGWDFSWLLAVNTQVAVDAGSCVFVTALVIVSAVYGCSGYTSPLVVYLVGG